MDKAFRTAHFFRLLPKDPIIEQAYRWKQFGLYAQDDWRVSPKLTLNHGLRYDLQIPRSDAKGQISTMNPTLPNPSAGGIPGAYEFFGKGEGRNGRFRLGDIDYLGFQPRFGFAYAPFGDGRTAIRGGFAVVRPIGNDNIESAISGGQYSTGFSGLVQYSRGGDGVLTSGYLSVTKRTKITERSDLLFQANFFNALNRVVFSNGGNAVTFIQNFAPPNLDAAATSDSIFGQMTAQQNRPRLIQFGMRRCCPAYPPHISG